MFPVFFSVLSSVFSRQTTEYFCVLSVCDLRLFCDCSVVSLCMFCGCFCVCSMCFFFFFFFFFFFSVFVFLSFPCSRRKDRKSWKTQKIHMRQVRTGKIEHLALLSGIMLLFDVFLCFFYGICCISLFLQNKKW